MTITRIAAICAAVLLLHGCMESDGDLFAASEKVELPVTGNWIKASGYLSYVNKTAAITRGPGRTYEALGLTGVEGVSSLSFVPLEGTGHYIAIGKKNGDRRHYYYLVRMEGADILIMEMGCPTDRIAGLVKSSSICHVYSRAALLAAAYAHMSDPKHYVGTEAGALYRRSTP